MQYTPGGGRRWVTGSAEVVTGPGHVGRLLPDEVHVGLGGADVLGREVGAPQPVEEPGVGPHEGISTSRARLAEDDCLPTTEVDPGHRLLIGHSPCKAKDVDESIGLGPVGPEPGATHRGPEHGRVHGNDGLQPDLGVVAPHHLLVLRTQQVEHLGPQVGGRREGGHLGQTNGRWRAVGRERLRGADGGAVSSPAMADTPTAAFSMRVRARLTNKPGTLGRLAVAIGDAGGNIAALEGFEAKQRHLDEDIVVNCISEAHQQSVLDAINALDGIEVLEWEDRTFKMHEGGKIEVLPLFPVGDRDDLSMAYTPGVARVCKAIEADPEKAHTYTIKKNTVAIVTDGTAVLGLGDIGPAAALPVMEGKALLFKEFAGVDAFPICLDTRSAAEIIETVQRLAPMFGGINLEDIAAPQCFEIEDILQATLDIPVFHDDQHGTAVVVMAALENALKIVDKKMADLEVVIAGVGAAGVAISKIMLEAGVPHVVGVDRQGAIWEGREDLNPAKQWFAENTNANRKAGSLAEVHARRRRLRRRVGRHGSLTADDLRTMGRDPDRVRHGEPRSRDPSRGGRRHRRGDRHRPQRLPQPDQQRAVLPRHLPRRARRRGHHHHRGHEAGGRRCDRLGRLRG